MLSFNNTIVGEDGWRTPTIEFLNPLSRMELVVKGKIINSITDNGVGQKEWKLKVAARVLAERKRLSTEYDKERHYCITLGFRFYPFRRGTFDVENYIKPVLDGIAAGLFEEDIMNIKRFDFADHNFRSIFFSRLEDASNIEQEGVAVIITAIDAQTIQENTIT